MALSSSGEEQDICSQHIHWTRLDFSLSPHSDRKHCSFSELISLSINSSQETHNLQLHFGIYK